MPPRLDWSFVRTILGAISGLVLLFGFPLQMAAVPCVELHSVIHISVDGLGGLYLSNYLALTPEEFPSFQRLKQEGAGTFNARCDSDNSTTEPNHTSMLTGRPVARQPATVLFSAPHGITLNYDPGPPWTLHTLGNPAVPYKASVFDVAHDHGLATAFFSGKPKFDLFIRSYDQTNGAPDRVDEDNGTGKIDLAAIFDDTSSLMLWEQSSNLVSLLTNHLAMVAPAYTFLHLVAPDIAGHTAGWDSQPYRDAVRDVDHLLGRLLNGDRDLSGAVQPDSDRPHSRPRWRRRLRFAPRCTRPSIVHHSTAGLGGWPASRPGSVRSVLQSHRPRGSTPRLRRPPPAILGRRFRQPGARLAGLATHSGVVSHSRIPPLPLRSVDSTWPGPLLV